MATVYFYEKPGCITNSRQKQRLTAAGHKVIALNLLTEPWQRLQLRGFFGDKPIAEWFNDSAPAIKQGDVKPEQLDEDQALRLMIANPLLIKRPLMQVGNSLLAGFDQQQVEQWIGLSHTAGHADLKSCALPSTGVCQLPS